MEEKDISRVIARELGAGAEGVSAAIALLDEGNTVPFIARYRKEATGGLTDEALRTLAERLTYLRNFSKRQGEILEKISEEGKLTPALRAQILKAEKLQELEDLYAPFKKKRRTRASMARERGLEPLAKLMLEGTRGTAEAAASAFISDEVPDAAAALAGALDILAEEAAENAALKKELREHLSRTALLQTELIEDAPEAAIYRMYAGRTEPVRTLPSHRILAINRGERQKALKVSLVTNEEKNISRLSRYYAGRAPFEAAVREAMADSYKRLLFPSLLREIRAELTERAEAQAIRVFGANLKELLLQPPMPGHTVLALDPGYRNGCKCAVVSPTGRILAHGIIFVTMGARQKAEAERMVLGWVKKYGVDLLSIGNGTASLETEEFASALIEKYKLPLRYLITNEAGASVYSASKEAADEMPEYDVAVRGAASLGRRVQDPLAELVKIDPKALGVGQYQHDVSQKALTETLDAAIEDAVASVGVDLNTASAALLTHVAGLNATTAKNVVAYRDEAGEFTSRRELLKVARLGKAAFTQCAGFLRLSPALAKDPLDSTSVHPESYELAKKLLAELGFTPADLRDKEKVALLAMKVKLASPAKLARKLGAGEPTVADALAALTRPGRDPRDTLPAPLTRKAILKLSDLKVGTRMRGTVQNITDFGAFVDIGLHHAGLVHISEIANRRVSHPLDVLSIGQIVDTIVIKVDEERGRIGLSIKQAQGK